MRILIIVDVCVGSLDDLLLAFGDGSIIFPPQFVILASINDLDSI